MADEREQEHARRTQVVPIELLEERDTVMPVRAYQTAPLAWLARGLDLAVERFQEQASVAQGDAREVAIPLFEALQWAVAIYEYLKKRGRASKAGDLKVLEFVRDRTHHQAASALYYEAESAEWRWSRATNLPPADARYSNPKGERDYIQQLQERPVVQALDAASRFARSLGPN
jgi:hypothetical protein